MSREQNHHKAKFLKRAKLSQARLGEDECVLFCDQAFGHTSPGIAGSGPAFSYVFMLPESTREQQVKLTVQMRQLVVASLGTIIKLFFGDTGAARKRTSSKALDRIGFKKQSSLTARVWRQCHDIW